MSEQWGVILTAITIGILYTGLVLSITKAKPVKMRLVLSGIENHSMEHSITWIEGNRTGMNKWSERWSEFRIEVTDTNNEELKFLVGHQVAITYKSILTKIFV